MTRGPWKLLRISRTKRRGRRVSRSKPQSGERYFTDGANLYRFAGWLARSENAKLAALEDCRTLRILLVNTDYLGQLSPPSNHPKCVMTAHLDDEDAADYINASAPT
jgi:hypothetical protein